MSSHTILDATTTRFTIHGVSISISSNSLAIINPADEHLQDFQDEDPSELPSLCLAFDAVETRDEIPVRISASAHKLTFQGVETIGTISWTEWPCEVFLDQGRIIMDFTTRGLLLIDGRHNQAFGYLVQPETWPTDLCMHFVYAGLRELLKNFGMYSTSAIALEKDGQGVLIAGGRAHGTTISFLSLLRSGYRCVSHDHLFLRATNEHIEALGFPGKVDVTDDTVKLFPELQEAGSLLHQEQDKKYFHVEDVYSWGTVDVCSPRVLLLPHVTDAATSHLEPLPKSKAMEALRSQGFQEISKPELQTFSRLVEQVDSYQLNIGQDVLELPQLINPLLDC